MSENDARNTPGFGVILTAFLGWLLAGVQLAVSSIVMRPAMRDLLEGSGAEGEVGQWFGWLTSSFLLGAAVGGYALGVLGDRLGRKRAMSISIATYAAFAGLSYFVASPEQLLLMRFMIGIGVGGMWPNGIALVSEAWPNLSRPMIAGVIGTAANVGIMLFSLLSFYVHVTPESWRWVMLLTSTPLVLAVYVWFQVPESPRWLALRSNASPVEAGARTPGREVFAPPLLWITLMGITLGTIPLFGGWGNANWANAWADQVGEERQEQGPGLKAQTMLARSGPGSVASLLGGAVAAWWGRRRFYFFLCMTCFACSQYVFGYSHPSEPGFLWGMGALGLFSGFFFGWLPLCLPELFPTRVRATGAGVSFNFGRIATALGILVVAGMLKSAFDGDYAQIGKLTSWVYVLGAVAIVLTPSTSGEGLQD